MNTMEITPMFRMYPHKTLSGANLVARLATILGTFIFCLVVLWYEQALGRVYQPLSFIPEDVWAATGVVICLYSLVHTCRQVVANMWSKLADVAMSFLWIYTVVGLFMFLPQLPAAAFAACAVMLVLSSMNILALPKERG